MKIKSHLTSPVSDSMLHRIPQGNICIELEQGWSDIAASKPPMFSLSIHDDHDHLIHRRRKKSARYFGGNFSCIQWIITDS